MKVFISIIALLTMNSLHGQTLKEHRWENRIVLIISNQENSQKCHAQMMEFRPSKEGLLDRKLVVYRVLPNRYKILDFEFDGEKEKWISSSEIFKQYAQPSEEFKVILIGLDGGVKLEKTEVLTTEELFRTIDAMPMRRAELRNREP